MNQLTTPNDSRRAPLTYEMLCGIVIVFALMLYGVLALHIEHGFART
jgi:hypothetical protein